LSPQTPAAQAALNYRNQHHKTNTMKPTTHESPAGGACLTQPVRLAVIDMSSFIECLPPDVRQKLSLHDIKRVCENYRKSPCGECHLQPGETCDICGAIQKPNARSAAARDNNQPHETDGHSTK